MTEWAPHREPLAATVARNITIALVAALAVAASSRRFDRLPVLTLLMLWPTFGGHMLDVIYLDWLRPRLPAARSAHIIARLVVWFVGGALLGAAIRITARAVLPYGDIRWLTWAVAGAAFVAIELVAHGGLQLRGRPSFYNGQG
jgi:hypothetical protein